MSIFNGVAGKRGGNPLGVCYHNDAGGSSCNKSHYENWLPGINPANGFAHLYVCSDGEVYAEDLSNKAWHCGNSNGNANYLSVEICQSMGDESQFLKNEQRAFDLTAEWFKQYNLTPSRDTVKIHKQFSATACPHRSVDLHGDGEALQDYIISELNKRIYAVVDVSEVNRMMCFYTVDDNPNVYWFNGFEVRLLTHPDQIVILNRVYKECYGKEIPSYNFKSVAPWHKRIIQACNGALQK